MSDDRDFLSSFGGRAEPIIDLMEQIEAALNDEPGGPRVEFALVMRRETDGMMKVDCVGSVDVGDTREMLTAVLVATAPLAEALN